MVGLAGDDLGLVAGAGLLPTGNVAFQFVVDVDKPSVYRDGAGNTFEYAGTSNDRRFHAKLLSAPYLVPDPSIDYFIGGELGQSYDSPGLIAGSIGMVFEGGRDSAFYGDAYHISIGVSGSTDTLFENWSVGEWFSGGEHYRALDGTASYFRGAVQLESIAPYRVDEPGVIFLMGIAAPLAWMAGRVRRKTVVTQRLLHRSGR